MTITSHHRGVAKGRGASPRRPCAGFTLIEIIVAASIMAIVLAVIHGAFYGALQMRQRSVDTLDNARPVEEALQIMEHDLASVLITGNTNGGMLIGPLQSVNQTNQLPGQIGPDFYTSSGELDGMTPWGNVEKIDYLLTAATNGYTGPGQCLVRAITRNLLSINQPPQPEEKEVILNGVRSLTFLYYDGTQWDPVWDTTQETNLPLAIKVQIQMATATGGLAANQPLELVVPLDILLNTNPVTPIQ